MFTVFLIMLLPGTAMRLRTPPSWTVTRGSKQLASSFPRLTAAQYHGGRMARPQMRLREELVAAAAAAAMNPTFIALDGLAVLLKVAWRIAVAAAIGLVLKDVIKDVLKSKYLRAITKYVRRIKVKHLRIIFAVVLASMVRRYLPRLVSKVFPNAAQSRSLRPRKPSKRRRRTSAAEEDADFDNGSGGDGGGKDGSGDGGGGGNGGGGDGGGDSGGGDGSGSGGEAAKAGKESEKDEGTYLRPSKATVGLRIQAKAADGNWYDAEIKGVDRGDGPTRVIAKLTGKPPPGVADMWIEDRVSSKRFRYPEVRAEEGAR